MRTKLMLRRIHGRLRKQYKLLPSTRKRKKPGSRYRNRPLSRWMERKFDQEMMQHDRRLL